MKSLNNSSALEDKLAKKSYQVQSDLKDIFPPHLTNSEILIGIKEGALHQGVFRASRHNFLEGFVNVESLNEPVIKKHFHCIGFFVHQIDV